MKFYQWLSKKIPAKLVYFATIRLLAEMTTGKYGHTVVPELTVLEALQRYMDEHNL